MVEGKNQVPFRLLYVVSHPIQYQVPLLRRLAADRDIELTVWFISDFSIRAHEDKGFGRNITWDVSLLGGYRHVFLAPEGQSAEPRFFSPWCADIERRLSSGKFDAVWLHGYSSFLYLRIVLYGSLFGLPVFVRGESHDLSAPYGATRVMLRRVILPILFGRLAGVLAIGTANREFYRRYGVPASRIFDVPYTVDNDFFRERRLAARANREAFRKELGLDPSLPIVLYASKFQARKRPDELLAAYRLLSPDGLEAPKCYLLFVGDGELADELHKTAAETNWQTIRFYGFQGQNDICKFYDLCDVFVLPGRNEPWGLVINEIMNFEKPVVVSRQAGCARDLVRDGGNGFHYTPGDVAGLSEILAKLIADSALRERMGALSGEIIARWSFAEDVAGIKEAVRLVSAEHPGKPG